MSNNLCLNICIYILGTLLLSGCTQEQDTPSQGGKATSPSYPEKKAFEPEDDLGKILKDNKNASVNEIAKYVNEKNINKRDMGTGDTPLLVATRYNNLPVVKFLLQKGAQPNDLYREPEYLKSYPALWFAVKWNNAAMVQALLDAGADPRIGETSGFGPIIHYFSESGGSNDALEQLLKADKTLANWKIWTGTPLHSAANSGHPGTSIL